MCLARKQWRSWTKNQQAHPYQSVRSLPTLLRYFCVYLSNDAQDLQQFGLLPGVSGTVSVSPESRSLNKRTVISSPLLDYPAYTLEACLVPISRHIWPCFLGKAFIHSMKVESTQLRYCYRIVVDSTFEYRTVSWKSMAPSHSSVCFFHLGHSSLWHRWGHRNLPVSAGIVLSSLFSRLFRFRYFYDQLLFLQWLSNRLQLPGSALWAADRVLLSLREHVPPSGEVHRESEGASLLSTRRPRARDDESVSRPCAEQRSAATLDGYSKVDLWKRGDDAPSDAAHLRRPCAWSGVLAVRVPVRFPGVRPR